MSAVRFMTGARACAAVVVCALLVTACGTPGEPPRSPTPAASHSASPSGMRPGSFSATLPTGASVRVSLPATPPPDPEVEQLRRDAGIRRALYAKVVIDNTKGTRPVSVSRLTVTSHDGGSYRLEALPRVVPGWAVTTGSDGARNAAGKALTQAQVHDLNERVERVVRHYTGDVPVGASGEDILVGDLDSLPGSFASVELIPSIASSEAPPVRPRPGPPPDAAKPQPEEAPGATNGGPGTGPPGPGQGPAAPHKPGAPHKPEATHEPEISHEPVPGREPDATARPPGPGGKESEVPGRPTHVPSVPPTAPPQAAPASPVASAPPVTSAPGPALPTVAVGPEEVELESG